MTDQTDTVPEKIVYATIACIESHGISGATTRKIAEMAEVNIAAINYYFRSKEALIGRALEVTLTNAFDLADTDPMPGATAQERCLAVMMRLVEGGLRFPGITRAHFHGTLAEGHENPSLRVHLERFAAELAADLGTREGAPPPAELKVAVVQIVSAVMMLILAPALFGPPDAPHPPTVDACREYVTRLVEKLLG